MSSGFAYHLVNSQPLHLTPHLSLKNSCHGGAVEHLNNPSVCLHVMSGRGLMCGADS